MIEISGQDVLRTVHLAVDAVRGAPAEAWDNNAGSLEWTCWETAEHLCDDLFAYAAQIAPRNPPMEGHVPFAWERKKPGGPPSALWVDREAGPEGLFQALDACGAILAAVVDAASPEVRAHHVHGVSDPEGFAAMGMIETLAHTHDVAEGLGAKWNPPAELCEKVLVRLFPDVEVEADPWATLLWATGRGELEGRERRTSWRWYGEPRA